VESLSLTNKALYHIQDPNLQEEAGGEADQLTKNCDPCRLTENPKS